MENKNTSSQDWQALNIDGFIAHIGPLLRRRDAKNNKHYALQTEDKHKNPMGIVHGGVITSLLDQVLALEAWNAANRQPTVTVQLDTRFMGAAQVGDLLEARVFIRKQTRSMIFIDADITVDDVTLASATAIMKTSKQAG